MKFTPAARKMLEALTDDRRAVVGNRAKRIAQQKDHAKVWKDDVLAALYCAGDEFLEDEWTTTAGSA